MTTEHRLPPLRKMESWPGEIAFLRRRSVHETVLDIVDAARDVAEGLERRAEKRLSITPAEMALLDAVRKDHHEHA